MFKTRLLSGIVLVIVLIATVGYGGNVLFAVLGIISLIGLSELYKVVDVHNKLLGMTGYLATVVYYGMLFAGKMEAMTHVNDFIFDSGNGGVCILISEISIRTGHDSVFRLFLRGSDAFLCLPDQRAAGWDDRSVADFLKLLGL